MVSVDSGSIGVCGNRGKKERKKRKSVSEIE